MAIKHLTFDDSGVIIYSSVTAAYQTMLAMTDDADVIFFINATDAPMYFRIPSGSGATKVIRVPANVTMTIDCRSNAKRIAKGSIEIKYASGAPTTGEVIVTVAR